MIDRELYAYLWNPEQYAIDKGKEIREHRREVYQRLQEKYRKIEEKYKKKT